MDPTALMVSLLGILSVLFIFLFYLFLKKDQNLVEMKAKYENLLKTESEQFKMSKQKDDYVAMMVHELRSPLSVIKGSADLVIREEKDLNPDQRYTLLSQIKTSATDLLDIVNDILDVSKIESGRFEIKKQKGNLNEVLKDEAEYYLALAREKDIEVITRLSEDIPEFEFDEDRIKHVMNNLLSNALKFTEVGGEVTIISKMIDQYNVEVAVCDNGSGVPDEMKGKLFNKFVQMENRRQAKEKGTGLGLVIAKGIVEAHGGGIWVEDNKPQGAKFLFTIPISQD
jgi:signal transduction histidine kinase